MAMTDAGGARVPFGVGSVLGGGFSLLFRFFGSLLLLALVPAVLTSVLEIWVNGAASLDVITAIRDPFTYNQMLRPVSQEAQFGAIIGTNVIWLIGSAIVCHAAWQGATEGRIAPGAAIGGTFSQIIPVLVCGVVTYLATLVGLVLLIVPGLYLAAFWFPIIPVLMAERIGPAAFGRASWLTEGYRWSIVGLILLYGLVVVLLSALAILAIHLSGPVTLLPVWVIVAIDGVTGAIAMALSSSIAVLAYLRLRDIKEGFHGEQMDEVFG